MTREISKEELLRKTQELKTESTLSKLGTYMPYRNIQKIVAPSIHGCYRTVTAAYNALPSTGGKILVLESTIEPAGDLTIAKPIILEAVTPGTSQRATDNPVKINVANATNYGIWVKDTVVFRNVCLDGPGSSGNSIIGLLIGSTGASAGDRSVFDNIVIKNFGSAGIQLGPAQLSYINFYNPVIDSVGVCGIYYYADAGNYVNTCNIFSGRASNSVIAFKTAGAGEKASSYINFSNGDSNERGLYLAGNFKYNHIIMPSWSPSVEDYYIDANTVAYNKIYILASSVSGTDNSGQNLIQLTNTGSDITIFKDSPSILTGGTDYTVDGTWTDLDLTSQTSVRAKAVLLRLQHLDTCSLGDIISVRKNGTTGTYPGHLYANVAGRAWESFVTCPMDTGQVIEYFATDASDTTITILGYIE